jgi:hypothetical protein
LVASVGALSACTGDKLTHVPGPATRTDVFAQATASKIDLLWVIDNSGSMADKQQKLANSFQRFIDEFTRGAVDYRIAVTTTDVLSSAPGAQGSFFGNPPVITAQDADPLSEFQANVKVGTAGSGNEEGLAGAHLALDAINNDPAYQATVKAQSDCVQACNPHDATCIPNCQAAHEPDFLRPDAYLDVIFVSDEDDKSPSEPIYYARYLDTVKGLGNAVEVSGSAIVGDGVSCDASNGVRYSTVSQLTGGVVGSICDDTFDANLTKLAENAVGLKRHFLLGQQPQVSTLDLKVLYRCDTPPGELANCLSVDDGCADQTADVLGLTCHPRPATQVAVDDTHPEGFTAGWSYQCSDNSLYFHRDATGDSVPGLRSQVQATYLPAAKGAACGG